MIFKKSALSLAGICFAITVPALADTTHLKADLQASLQRSVDRMLIDGALMHVDLQTGQTQALYPVEAHPMILQMGEHYVLCSDLKALDGTENTVDYYLTKNGTRYSLIRTEINNREPLKALMKAGVVSRLE